MKVPRLLKGFHNPCWIECISREESYYSAEYAPRDIILKPLKALNDTMLKQHPKWRLRCLPKFLLIGMPKCGSTDMFSKYVLCFTY